MTRFKPHDLARILARENYGIPTEIVPSVTPPKTKKWDSEDIEALRSYYANTPPETFSIMDFASSIGRTFASVALKASRLGISEPRSAPAVFSAKHRQAMSFAQKKRSEKIGGHIMAKPLIDYVKTNGSAFKGKKHTEEFKRAESERAIKWYSENEHPRGMAGKTHSPETRAAISEANTGVPIPRERVMRMLKTKSERGNLCNPRPQASWKSGWIELGGKRLYARSRWEANYARYLQWLKERNEILDWEHEPKTFWFMGIKRGCVSYLPDFMVKTNSGQEEYHEVKGWMDARSKTKIKRMQKYHPTVLLIVIDSTRYKALSKTLKSIIPGWE